MTAYLTIDGRKVALENEESLLQVIRKANIDIPTFCYHSELSVYGACRLCMVDVKGRGLVSSCSLKPAPDMEIRTNTEEIREVRRTIIELLLAGSDHNCTTCQKGPRCQLYAIARRLGIDKVSFRSLSQNKPVDTSSPALVRDPNKCVLCGDCVRMCSEVQGIGAIDFAWRGASSAVVPAFNKDLGEVECVNCGQCAAVCPTGALVPKSEIEDVWKAIHAEGKIVAAQIAPAVRVALGEHFGMETGASTSGPMVAALRRIGFDRVYDTSFAADLTIWEEANEFVKRVKSGERLPLFTSCCPAWVKFCEQYYPDLLDNLSTCRSPQQMFGAIAKEQLSRELNLPREKIVVVSIMPCTAKKFEARRPEFAVNGNPDVDHVLTTQELGRMIEDAGIRFHSLRPESFDLPFGFKTGAGVIFGHSGGVTEAVLRYLGDEVTTTEVLTEGLLDESGLRELDVTTGGRTLRIAVVHGLKNAHDLLRAVEKGEKKVDFVEFMACPGGCVGGGGQPVNAERDCDRVRAQELRDNDRMLAVHRSQENPYVAELYERLLGEVGGPRAHQFLHTHYHSRRRLAATDFAVAGKGDSLDVRVCVGTGCYLRGAQTLVTKLSHFVSDRNLEKEVSVSASFCHEFCDRGPTVTINGERFERCTFDQVSSLVSERLGKEDACNE